jgi:ERF superfamily.
VTEVQERPIDKVSAAFAKAQGDFKELAKNRVAKVPMKSGGHYSYKYADLHDVMLSVRDALKANELAV